MTIREKIHAVKLWAIIIFVIVIGLVSFFTTNAEASPYVDIGLSYVNELGIIQKASAQYQGSTITTQNSISLDIEEWVGMMRVGYLFNSGLGVEYDTIGTPDYYINRVNIYYRYEF